jgi:hypothetical protein
MSIDDTVVGFRNVYTCGQTWFGRAARQLERIFCDITYLFAIWDLFVCNLGPIYWQCTLEEAVDSLVASPPTCAHESMYPSGSKHTLELPLLQDARRLASNARLTQIVAILVNAQRESVFQVRLPSMQCLLYSRVRLHHYMFLGFIGFMGSAEPCTSGHARTWTQRRPKHLVITMAQPCMQITDGTRHKGRLAEPPTRLPQPPC